MANHNHTTKPDRTKTCPDCDGEIGTPLICLGRLHRSCADCGNVFDSPEALAIAWTARILIDRGVLA